MGKGYSFEAFCAHIGHHKPTVYRWLDDFPEFREAKELAFDKSRLFWEKLGILGAAGKVPGFNAASFIFNMKNRFNWRDKVETNVDLNLADEIKKARERVKNGR